MFLSEINKQDNAIIVVADYCDNLFLKLNNIVHGNDKYCKLTPEDLFVLGIVVLPGSEMLLVANLSDDMGRNDVDFVQLPKDVLRPVQADEDCKHLITLLQPRYVIPINGLYKQEVKFTQAITSLWIKVDQIISLDNGWTFICNR